MNSAEIDSEGALNRETPCEANASNYRLGEDIELLKGLFNEGVQG